MTLAIEAHGSSYRIEDPGGLIGKALRAGNPYEARVLEHIYRQGLEGSAVDVGANVGNHSLWLACVCGLEVVAFEPGGREYLQLLANVELNGAAVSPQNVALGEAPGRARSLGKGRWEVGAGEAEVRTLDSYGLRDVALIKIDVEGMEPQVIVGATRTITEQRPLIYAEAQDAAAHEAVASLLEPLGYTHTKTFGATPLEEWRP